jgi:beta-mannosidase
MKKVLVNNWNLAYMPNSEYVKSDFQPFAKEDIIKQGLEIIPASVPGNFELDFIKAKKLPEDIYFGTNILEVQKLESMHLWYFTDFEIEESEKEAFILFEGIDTAAEIFIDGAYFAFCENMLIPYEFSLDCFESGKHQVMVHIIPAGVFVRDIPLDPNCRAMKYNMDSLLIRKAPYMYGWDIMPRTVSAGLWRPVSVVYKNRDRIADYRIYTNHIHDEKASITLDTRIITDKDDLRDFSIIVKAECGESKHESHFDLFSVNKKTHFDIANPLLWWPKNYGKQNLYDVTLTLLYKGEAVDEETFKFGIRTVDLERTSVAGADGTFRFIVNNKPIMCLGTNWVPTDAFPSRHDDYTLRGLELTNELNCNMIRCWGGNVYPSDMFYDYCDEHGILVWQDFSMACGAYPQDERFQSLLKEEAESVVTHLRNRTCLALWSGDNECDYMFVWDRSSSYGKFIHQKNPNNNVLTRKVLPEVIGRLDGNRPYIPSSPYLDEEAFKTLKPAEDHLWGPRDYFKGDFYNKNSVCHFASETGYHGCPAPESLRKFIGEKHIEAHGNSQVCDDPEWLVHAACPEVNTSSPWAYRIPLMTKQIDRIFGNSDDEIHNFCLKSQISQAEAVKFFIEHFRIQKNYRWGILWWNIIDGWPQISDAVVDWYGTKKLAYGYIKRAQQPFNIMCDEPDENGMLELCAVNDNRMPVTVEFTVTEALSGRVMASGNATVGADEKLSLGKFKESNGEYYIISWSGEANGINHFTGAIGDTVRLEDYVEFMKKADFYKELEGF